PRRHALLYRLLWRLAHGERALLEVGSDPDVAWAHAAAKAVRREKHKMKAFVRFREVAGDQGPVFISWFEPVHDVLPQVAPFFVKRDRKSTRLNSSHVKISYAVFCLKKKNNT